MNNIDVAHNSAGDDEAKNVHRWLGSTPSIEVVPISALRAGDSPRTTGVVEAHIRSMAATESGLPPIVVHRSTMRVIDGMHRIRTAELRGQTDIAVHFFEGTSEEAFVMAVSLNVSHGMPLSLKDRKAAASRILSAYPHWSDRLVASIAGLSHRTVGAMRQRSSGQQSQLNDRLGRDGRRHPLDLSERRETAADLIRQDSTVSLREVARRAGISLGTASDVHRRVINDNDATPKRTAADAGEGDVQQQRVEEKRGNGSAAIPVEGASNRSPKSHGGRRADPKPLEAASDALKRLRKNPALRFNEEGRALIRLLAISVSATQDCERLALRSPDHSQQLIADVALMLSESWHDLSARIQAAFVVSAEAG